MPSVYVIAGPNGAGKSTMAARILGRYLTCPDFVNADVIARGLSAFNPGDAALEAGRVMLRRLDDLAARRVDFAFETTLASRTFAPWLRKRQEEGYEFHLIFAWLPHADMAVNRVAARVAAGGHNIPEADIRRRYERSVANFLGMYRNLADRWEVYDNSGEPRMLARGGRLIPMMIIDPEGWQSFTEGHA